MRTLDPDALFRTVLGRPDLDEGLDELELFVYVVKEIESRISMTGWDEFFVGSSSYLYPALRRCLQVIEDSASLAIIDSYVGYLAERGIQFDPEAMDDYWRRQADLDRDERVDPPDWGAAFDQAQTQRWQRMASYLRLHGVELIDCTLPANVEPDPLTAQLLSELEASLQARVVPLKSRRRSVKPKRE